MAVIIDGTLENPMKSFVYGCSIVIDEHGVETYWVYACDPDLFSSQEYPITEYSCDGADEYPVEIQNS